MTYKIHSSFRSFLSDRLSLTDLFLKLRDKFPHTLLWELSPDSQRPDSRHSYLCFHRIAFFSSRKGEVKTLYPDGQLIRGEQEDVWKSLVDFMNQFEFSGEGGKYYHEGMFGHIGYEAVQYVEDIVLQGKESSVLSSFPDLEYAFYRFVLVLDHTEQKMTLIEHHINGTSDAELSSDRVLRFLKEPPLPLHKFRKIGSELSNLNDEGYKDLVEKGKSHCLRGDVYQIVLSRKFSQAYKGDAFQVYRALSHVNPSPYGFYVDHISYELFGTSPETQLRVLDGKAYLFPIAGTYPKKQDLQENNEQIQQLMEDKKEHAEHAMLVDLSRHDLSRHALEVRVEEFKQLETFSHVLHLVSRVSGRLENPSSSLPSLAGSTFPAGTLTGAPKHQAMKLIDHYEGERRGFYGGAIGFWGVKGIFDHAIIIRSVYATGGYLHYQAGAGIVAESSAESENQEVHNKLKAIRKAIQHGHENTCH
ncbi:MAG: anthranilate synthase component I family protein [Cytophagales bacterium]|nr:anthranilate synthase component I family protein [Cytophagales bacterium]